ncbi:MAG: UPF0175 family protein [Phycisphaerales bacterium]
MTISIPDNIVRTLGRSERDVLIEIACVLFDADKLDASSASELARLDRDAFEAELRSRGIPVVRPTVEEFEADLRVLRDWDRTA